MPPTPGPVRRTAAPVAALLVALGGLTGCQDQAPGGTPSDEPDGTATTSQESPEGPQEAKATVALLDWQPTGGSPEDRRIVGREWSSLVDQAGSTAVLRRDDTRLEVPARGPRRISTVLLDDRWAVVVAEDPREGMPRQRPPAATMVDLDRQRTAAITDPPPGASWAMHEGQITWATFDRAGAYCVAELDAATGAGELTGCAEPREGITRLTRGAAGTAWISFDDRRPVSCRTPVVMTDAEPVPVEQAAKCSAWDVAATPDGAVWSEVSDERRAEEGDIRASRDGTTYDLGPGTTGTLVPCGDSVWWTRDPQRRRDPARLMRWTPDGELQVAFASRSRGNAFLAPPECAGDVLTVSAFGSRGGDEQVWAVIE